MTRRVTEVKTLPKSKPRMKVAAYCRVSMDTEQLRHSFSQQVSYYNGLIQSNPEWDFAGIYADLGISGTSMAARPDFQRMLADCEDGKIDLILVKSISRFARNKLELLETTRHLKEIGVEVRFEREHLSSTSSDGELLLTLLASFAEEEVVSLSNNVKWAVQKKFKNGEEFNHNRALGYRFEGDERVIVPEEADIVRWLFETYATGEYSMGKLSKLAREKGFRGINGVLLSSSTVSVILKNEIYKGDRLLQKTYGEGVHVRRVNRGEKPKYYVEDAHEAIVPRELFDRVQKIMKVRGAGSAFRKAEHTCFSQKVVCGYCGAALNRRNWVTGKVSKTGIKRWNCTTREKEGNAVCSLKPIMEEDLKMMASEALEMETLNEEDFARKVKKVVLYDRTAEFVMDDDRIKTVRRPNPSYALKGKCTCGDCGANFGRFRYSVKNDDGTYRYYWKCSDRATSRKQTDCSCPLIAEEELIQIASKALGLDEIDEDRVDNEIRHAKVGSDEIIFTLSNGEEKVWRRK